MTFLLCLLSFCRYNLFMVDHSIALEFASKEIGVKVIAEPKCAITIKSNKTKYNDQ